jgi:hypothetical protein
MEREEPTAPNDLGETAATLPAIRERPPKRRAPARSSTTRLSLNCILLWIAGAAATMAAVRKLNPIEPGVVGLLLVSGYAAGCGVAWTGSTLLIARAFRGARWPIEPGHWLLAASAVHEGLELSLRLAAPRAFTAPAAVVDAATCCCLVLPLLSRTLPALWKGCFALLCALVAWPLAVAVIESFLFAPPDWLEACTRWIELRQIRLVALTAACFAFADWRAFRERSWLHWAGLGVWAWLAAVSLFSR